MRALMLISKEKQRYKAIDSNKVKNGVFYTRKAAWLKPQVVEFIKSVNPRTIIDPFAGSGDMLNAVRKIVYADIKGYDIDGTLGWECNDSLVSIPLVSHGLIVTNPPFLARHSAKRKRVFGLVEKYYSRRDDLYQVALDNCIRACRNVVSIVPETFINSDYPKSIVKSITIIEDNPFRDTDCPVCVLCIDGTPRPESEILMFRNSELLGNLGEFNGMRLHPKGQHRILFNDRDGAVGLRAVDLTDPEKPIQFLLREELGYSTSRIKTSSRLVTYISLPEIPVEEVERVVHRANEILSSFREATRDTTLSPFKGNTKQGARRRRLDYYTARAILEKAIDETGENNRRYAQLTIFGAQE